MYVLGISGRSMSSLNVVKSLFSSHVMGFLYPAIWAPRKQSVGHHQHSNVQYSAQRVRVKAQKPMDNILIRALVMAGSCREHSNYRPARTSGSVHMPGIRPSKARVFTYTGKYSRTIHTSTADNAAHCHPTQSISVSPLRQIREKTSKSRVDHQQAPLSRPPRLWTRGFYTKI